MQYQTKILVIEDDRLMCETIRNILIQRGYDTCCAFNGASGIQKAFEYNPDAVLCDIKMEPIDGYQVYQVLKESSIIERIPFIFISGLSEQKDRRFGLNLGADDFFVKPFDNETLVQVIENRLTKYKKLKEIGRREFMALFKLTTNGAFIFDGHSLIEANPVLIKMLQLKREIVSGYPVESFLDQDTISRIREKIASNQLTGESFEIKATLISASGEKISSTLYISAFEKYSLFTLFLGVITIYNKNEPGIDLKVIIETLQREKITVTDSLGARLAEAFKKYPNGYEVKNSFFSQREYEVLRLSMDGLSTKIIADKLFISDRTVEKHRANLMEKTNSKNMIEVIVYALKNNLISV